MKTKNKKSYIIPLKVEAPIMYVDSKELSIWDKKKCDAVGIKIPNWLWDCIKEKCQQRYEDGKNDLKREIREKLGY